MGISIDSGISGRWYNKWINIVCDAMSCYDNEKGLWVHLPNSGGYYDQDVAMMDIWECVRIAYIKAKRDPEILNYLQSETERQTKQLSNKMSNLKGKR